MVYNNKKEKREELKMAKLRQYYTISKSKTYDLDEIMELYGCDRESAMDIAYDDFDEAPYETELDTYEED